MWPGRIIICFGCPFMAPVYIRAYIYSNTKIRVHSEAGELTLEAESVERPPPAGLQQLAHDAVGLGEVALEDGHRAAIPGQRGRQGRPQHPGPDDHHLRPRRGPSGVRPPPSRHPLSLGGQRIRIELQMKSSS